MTCMCGVIDQAEVYHAKQCASDSTGLKKISRMENYSSQ